jgi:hypothetical protein
MHSRDLVVDLMLIKWANNYRGRMVYLGSPLALSAHLAGFGRPIPEGGNC